MIYVFKVKLLLYTANTVTLAVFDSAEEADRFLTYLNNLHSSIQFTIDKESHDKLCRDLTKGHK